MRGRAHKVWMEIGRVILAVNGKPPTLAQWRITHINYPFVLFEANPVEGNLPSVSLQAPLRFSRSEALSPIPAGSRFGAPRTPTISRCRPSYPSRTRIGARFTPAGVGLAPVSDGFSRLPAPMIQEGSIESTITRFATQTVSNSIGRAIRSVGSWTRPTTRTAGNPLP